MKLSPQRLVSRTRRNITSFGGLDRSSRANGTKLGDMLNMTSDLMPSLSSRTPRAMWRSDSVQDGGTVSGAKIYVNDEITAAATVNGRLCFATNKEIIADGVPVTGAKPEGEGKARSIIPFGRAFLLIPDGLFARKNEGTGYTSEKCGHSFYSAEGVTVTPVDSDGVEITSNICSVLPQNANENDSVILLSDSPSFVWEYKNGGWIKGRRVCPSYRAENIGDGFRTGDSVILKNADSADKKRTYRVLGVKKDEIILDAPFCGVSSRPGFSVTRYFPVLDCAVESNNRIWGCRYGTNIFGDFVNEIYACSAGDPFSWDTFDGISTDSYTVSLGCPGEFTGAAVLDGKPVFFKENHIITVSGVSPQSYTVTANEGRGVESGAAKSVVNLNEVLFYKNAAGIIAYDGATARCISEELGTEKYTAGAAGGADGKYRVVLTSRDGEKRQYVYDILNNVWHIEDDKDNAVFFFRIKGRQYSVCLVSESVLPSAKVNTYMFCIHDGTDAENGMSIFRNITGLPCSFVPEKDIPFLAETRSTEITDGSGMIRSLVIRADKDEDAVLRVGIICGDSGEYRELYCTERGVKGTFAVPVNTPRCTSFRIRFSGHGRVKILSVGVITEKTGEVNGYGQ